MSDYRMTFLQDVEAALVTKYGADQASAVTDVVMKVLNGYEIVERCTDLVPLDDRNERILKRYSACMMIDGKSKRTIRQYLWTARRLSDLIRRPFTEMGAYDVRFFLATEKERGISDAYLENMRSYLSTFFQWMTDEEIITKNPMSRLKPIRCPSEVRKPFTDIEIDALRSACHNLKDRALIEILLSTGVRVSELAKMEVKDINQTTLAVHVVHGKGKKERITHTTPVCLKHLNAYLNARSEKDSPAVFCNLYHEPLGVGGIQTILKDIGKRAGVEDVYPHRFRHTFATNLAKRGMDIQEIQRLLGHTNISTTMRYISIDDERVKSSYHRYIA